MTDTKNDPIKIAQNLIRCPSVTPEEGGALTYLQDLLKEAGFTTHRVIFDGDGSYPVDNLYARYGTGAPHFCYAGHTDVVPTGSPSLWTHDPFSATIDNGILYGRGAVDMKGSIATFAAAAIDYIEENPGFAGSISFLITGDEEADSINGTEKLIEWVKQRGETPDATIVGEPTNVDDIGDSIKVGRRGSLSGNLIVRGTQGHVAYQHNADNPIPRILPLLQALVEPALDQGSEFFDPTNLEITSVDVGNKAKNVIPAEVSAKFNIRFNDNWSPETLRAEIRQRIKNALLDDTKYELSFIEPVSENFLTQDHSLVKPLQEAILSITGKTAKLSTGGGSSDARFIKNYCPVIEFGLLSRTIHSVDENTSLEDIHTVTAIFREFLNRYFAGQPK